jgi:hypothetical protein
MGTAESSRIMAKPQKIDFCAENNVFDLMDLILLAIFGGRCGISELMFGDPDG